MWKKKCFNQTTGKSTTYRSQSYTMSRGTEKGGFPNMQAIWLGSTQYGHSLFFRKYKWATEDATEFRWMGTPQRLQLFFLLHRKWLVTSCLHPYKRTPYKTDTFLKGKSLLHEKQILSFKKNLNEMVDAVLDKIYLPWKCIHTPYWHIRVNTH